MAFRGFGVSGFRGQILGRAIFPVVPSLAIDFKKITTVDYSALLSFHLKHLFSKE
jgi:hypothetical protein